MRIGGIMAAQAPGAQRRKPLVMATPVGPPASSSSFSSSSYSTSSSAAAAPAYASDDDDDEDDEDDVWAARRPGKQASITCGTKRDAEAAVLRDVLVLKAQYGDLDGVPAHARLQSDFVVTTTKKLQAQLGITFIVAVNNTSAKKLAAKKGQLQINCFYDGKNARKNCKCDFGLSAYVKLGSAIITRIGLEHSQGCEVFSKGGRRNGAKTDLLQMDKSSSWASALTYSGIPGLHNGLGGILQRGMARHDGVLMNIAQAHRYVRKQQSVTLPQSILNMTLLAPFLLACKAADPKGLYLLGTKQGTYKLDGIDATTMREFEWAIIIPSYMIKF